VPSLRDLGPPFLLSAFPIPAFPGATVSLHGIARPGGSWKRPQESQNYPRRVSNESAVSLPCPSLGSPGPPASVWLAELRLPRPEEDVALVAGLRFDLRYGTKWHSSVLREPRPMKTTTGESRLCPHPVDPQLLRIRACLRQSWNKQERPTECQSASKFVFTRQLRV